MMRLLHMDDGTFSEIDALLRRLRGERRLSPAEQNLVLYVEDLLRRRQWSADLAGFLPHLRALAGRSDPAGPHAAGEARKGHRPQRMSASEREERALCLEGQGASRVPA